MALHNTINCPGFTENQYRAYKDGEDAYNRYQRNDLRLALQTPLHYTESAASGAMPPHVFINDIIVPENRELLDPAISVCSPIRQVIIEAGNMPYRNMNNTVKTWKTQLGNRICIVDHVNPNEMVESILKDGDYFSTTATYDLFNKYPAGAPLTKAEIDALKKNKLRPCIGYHKDANSKVDAVHFSNGALCTGYVQLLDDALQLFKNYCSTCIGKRFVNDYPGVTWEVYPRRIVYDPSRLIKSCSNPIINEAAQIALECDMVSSKGVKTKGALHLSNPNTYEESRVIDEFSADYVASKTMSTDLLLKYLLNGRKDLLLLIFITSCYYFKEDLEAQAK